MRSGVSRLPSHICRLPFSIAECGFGNSDWHPPSHVWRLTFAICHFRSQNAECGMRNWSSIDKFTTKHTDCTKERRKGWGGGMRIGISRLASHLCRVPFSIADFCLTSGVSRLPSAISGFGMGNTEWDFTLTRIFILKRFTVQLFNRFAIFIKC